MSKPSIRTLQEKEIRFSSVIVNIGFQDLGDNTTQ